MAEDVDSLTLISRVYYWTAAAVQAIRAGRKPIYGPIITKMENMHSRVESPYKEAVKMYFSIVRGTQALRYICALQYLTVVFTILSNYTCSAANWPRVEESSCHPRRLVF